MPFVTSSFLLLAIVLGAASSVLATSSDALCYQQCGCSVIGALKKGSTLTMLTHIWSRTKRSFARVDWVRHQKKHVMAMLKCLAQLKRAKLAEMAIKQEAL